MTIDSEILKLQTNLADSYTACNGKGATMPANQNFDNLPDCIDSIQSSTPAVITSLAITPSTTQQVITAPSGTDGYNPITVNAVTSSIDANIVAGNIKKDVQILGVTGTYEGSSGGEVGIPRSVLYGNTLAPIQDANYTFTVPSSITTIRAQALAYLMLQATNLQNFTLNCSATNIQQNAFKGMCQGCISLQNVTINITTLNNGGNVFNTAFSGGWGGISISFPILSTVDNTWGDPLADMLASSSNCTVHFPSSLQSVIGSWSSVTNGFGGTNTTVLFDL